MNKPRISIIVAMDEKRGIGKNNQLMWRIPGELPRFKRITTGHPIIMGRKTFESVGRVLPGRTNIIITRDKQKVLSIQQSVPENLIVVSSLDEALKVAKETEETASNAADTMEAKEKEIFVIGGGQIFTQALPVVDRLYLTIVKGDFGADTFFPEYKAFTNVIEKEAHADSIYTYSFLTLQKL